jgi:hypothetical protein
MVDGASRRTTSITTWIGIRRGRCVRCGRIFTFLPVFSLPYTHYSLLARCQGQCSIVIRALCTKRQESCDWGDLRNYAKGLALCESDFPCRLPVMPRA